MRRTNINQTPVIFKKSGDYIVAFLLRVPANRGRIACFDLESGYGEATLEFFWDCEPAQPSEYASLLKTLQEIGYDIVVRQRMTYADTMAAWAAG